MDVVSCCKTCSISYSAWALDRRASCVRAYEMKQLIENFAAVLGALTVVLLLMSVSHEYGYYAVVGRHFQTFLTTTDYFANAILWLPLSLFVLWGWVDWSAVTGRRPYLRIDRNWRSWVLPSIFGTFLLLGFFFTFKSIPALILFPLIYVWGTYVSDWLPFKGTQDPLLNQIRGGLITVPVAMACLFAYGYMNGATDLHRVDDIYTLQQKQGEPLRRVILRNFDKGVLVRDIVQKRIEFIRWDDLSRVTKNCSRSSKSSTFLPMV